MFKRRSISTHRNDGRRSLMCETLEPRTMLASWTGTDTCAIALVDSENVCDYFEKADGGGSEYGAKPGNANPKGETQLHNPDGAVDAHDSIFSFGFQELTLLQHNPGKVTTTEPTLQTKERLSFDGPKAAIQEVEDYLPHSKLEEIEALERLDENLLEGVMAEISPETECYGKIERENLMSGHSNPTSLFGEATGDPFAGPNPGQMTRDSALGYGMASDLTAETWFDPFSWRVDEDSEDARLFVKITGIDANGQFTEWKIEVYDGHTLYVHRLFGQPGERTGVNLIMDADDDKQSTFRSGGHEFQFEYKGEGGHLDNESKVTVVSYSNGSYVAEIHCYPNGGCEWFLQGSSNPEQEDDPNKDTTDDGMVLPVIDLTKTETTEDTTDEKK